MLLSEQKRVAQEANQNIVGIRSAEINYFSSFFISFGTQAALLATFAARIAPIQSTDCPRAFQYIYWLAKVASFMCAMHVVLISAFITVFGQGLALRGPIGSMAKAVEGMVQEQSYCMSYFVAAIVFFNVTSFSLNWGYMTLEGSILTTILSILGMIVWYSHCLRIYNRFRFAVTGSSSGTKIAFLRENTKDLPHIETMKRWVYGSGMINSYTAKPVGGLAEKFVYHEGYVSTTLANQSTGRPSGEWQMVYMVLFESLLFLYMDKTSFESDPKHPIRRRPVDLEGLRVRETIDQSYSLRLEPIDAADERKVIELRCQTLTDVTAWIEAFNQASAKANRSADAKNLK